MTPDQLRQLLELGWPGLITIAFVILAKWYRDDMTDQLKYLRSRIDILETNQKSISERLFHEQ